MTKECWVGPAYRVEPISRALGLVTHPLELAAYPPDDIIDYSYYSSWSVDVW